MNYTTQKGLLTELQCQNDFTRAGILLSQPIINDSRYDFLADINGQIIKVQCKTANPKDEAKSAIEFSCCSKNWNNGIRHTYKDEIDYFYTSWNDKGYLIPVEKTGTRAFTLRFYSKLKTSGGSSQINWASEYEFEKILKDNFNYEVPIYSPPTSQNGQKIKEYKYCASCGKEISPNATYCSSCANKNKRSTEMKISREELKKLIRTEPFTEIGKKFNMTDNGVINMVYQE